MRIAIVGAGIAGLTAALELHDQLGEDADITIIDGAQRPGGKLATGAIGGRWVETGAETFLARAADDPSGAPSAAVLLARRLGLDEALRHPATTAAGVLRDGELIPVPGGTMMGIPIDGSTEDDRDEGRPILGDGEDISVGALVRARVGDDAVDRLVDPLLGGVYAGRADDLSLAVTIPGLAAACRRENTLHDAVRAALNRRASTPGPVFATIDGGLSRMVDAIVTELPAGALRLGLPVRSLEATGTGWRLTVGSTRDPETIEADAVILAVPSRPAARLLETVSPDVAVTVGELDYASIALVTFVLPAGALDGTGLEGRSGALIPAIEGHLIKAVTVFSTKWAAQPDGAVLLRCSVGRYGEEESLQLADGDLVMRVHGDLSKIVGKTLPAALDAAVTRWGGALPQYKPGHLGRVASARAGLPASIALAGAAYDGIGIPVCVKSGQAAARQIIELEENRNRD